MEEKIIHGIQKSGYRVTSARKKIVRLLLKSKEPITIQMLVTKVDVDEVSVYRTIKLLVALGIVEEINEPGITRRYAVTHGHHHHIVCTKCNRVAHIPCREKKEQRLQHPEFHNIENHDVTYYGHCRNCV